MSAQPATGFLASLALLLDGIRTTIASWIRCIPFLRPADGNAPALPPEYYKALRALGKAGEIFKQYPDLAAQPAALQTIEHDARAPLIALVMGQFKSGKSTFLNALLGEELLVTGVTPMTAAVTRLSYGETRKVVAHLDGGTTRELPFEWLGKISAEGDEEGARLREELSFLEVFLPNPLLQKISFVDTPGLNSVNLRHTEATRAFLPRADAVLWVFSATQAGSAVEMTEITHLPAGCRLIGVINQIDEIDPDEDSLDEIATRLQRLMGSAACSFIGISARQAFLAQQEHNEVLLKQSGWQDFHTVLEEMTAAWYAQKIHRLREKITGYLQQLESINQRLHQSFAHAEHLYFESGNRAMALRRLLTAATELREQWNTRNRLSACEVMWHAPTLPAFINRASRLNDVRLPLRVTLQKVFRQLHDEEIRPHYLSRISDYELPLLDFARNLPGVSPIADSDRVGGGWRRYLMDRRMLIPTESPYVLIKDQLDTTADGRVTRAEHENAEYVAQAYTALNDTVRFLDGEVKAAQQQLEQQSQARTDLLWTRSAVKDINAKLLPRLQKVVKSLQQSTGSA